MRIRLTKSVPLEPLAAKLPKLKLSWLSEGLLSVEAPEDWTAPKINAVALPVLLESGAEVLEVLRGETLEAVYLSQPNGVSTPKNAKGSNG